MSRYKCECTGRKSGGSGDRLDISKDSKDEFSVRNVECDSVSAIYLPYFNSLLQYKSCCVFLFNLLQKFLYMFQIAKDTIILCHQRWCPSLNIFWVEHDQKRHWGSILHLFTLSYQSLQGIFLDKGRKRKSIFTESPANLCSTILHCFQAAAWTMLSFHPPRFHLPWASALSVSITT